MSCFEEYRGKSLVGGSWFYGSLIKLKNNQSPEGYIYRIVNELGEFVEIQPETRGQLVTTFRDSEKGKFIPLYEGDVIAVYEKVDEEMVNRFFIPVYSAEEKYYLIKFSEEDVAFEPFCLICFDPFNINLVGNILDNPDWLSKIENKEEIE